MEMDLTEANGKISLSETKTMDEAGLIEEYRRGLMDKMVCEKVINNGPEILESIRMQIKIKEITINSLEVKKNQLVEILKENNINFEEKIKEIRNKYSDEDILNKSSRVIAESKTEIKKVGDKYEMTTTSMNDIEDLIFEIMSLNNQIPENNEALIKDATTEKNTQKKIQTSEEYLKKTQEKLRRIKVFFADRHKNIDKLLDEAAQQRPKEKVAETLNIPKEEKWDQV